MKKRLGEGKDKFEATLNNTLIKQYNDLLHVRIKAKFDTFVPESDRLKAAKQFLAGLE